MRVVFIGAGNIAVSLAIGLQERGHGIVQVWSRTEVSACQLAGRLEGGVQATASLDCIVTDADLYVLAVKDGVLVQMAEQLAGILRYKRVAGKERLFVHVACTQAVEVLAPLREFGRTGVLYPFQSFVRSRVVDLSKVAFFVEGDDEDSRQAVRELARSFSAKVYDSSLEQRQYLHFAGNMAANFSNCLYCIAKEVLDEAQLPFEVLFPIVEETAHKIQTLSPREAQSGPAVRGDEVTIEKHLALIDRLSTMTATDQTSPVALKDMYGFFTHNIQRRANG